MDYQALFSSPTLENFISSLDRQLTFLADEQGKVLKIFSQFFRHEYSIFLSLQRTRDLFDAFGLRDRKPLSDLIRSGNSVEIFQPSHPLSSLDRFYTSMPIGNLRIFPLEKNLFFCYMQTTSIFPITFPESGSCFVYIDKPGRMKGFNESFFKLFENQFPSPSEILDRDAGLFMEPTPAQIQRNYLELHPAERLPRPFKTIAIPGPSPAVAWAAVNAQPPKTVAEGLLLEHAKGDLGIVSLLESFDAQRTDFRMRMDFETRRGRDPLFVFSGADPAAVEGDDVVREGYLVGRHAALPLSILKKRGVVVSTGTYGQEPSKNFRLEFLKIGKSFRLFLNNAEALSYFDPEPFLSPAARLGMGLLPGSLCLLKTLAIDFFEPAKPHPESSETTIQLKDSRKSVVALNRFHSPVFSSWAPFYDTACYYLQNVTHTQNLLVRVRQEYETQLKRGDHLENLLAQRVKQESLIVGSGAAITAVREKAGVVGESNVTVLIQGETGTGKEVLARHIHNLSPLRKGPFIKIDCSTLPKELMESELFGHEKGAFTGAFQTRSGIVEQANHGTLFIDEVANLTLEAQKKLLQFLQDFSITRVGGVKTIALDLRVIAASNIPLKKMVDGGHFREDLYYRLKVVAIDLPPLLKRKEDLPELCAHFIELFCLQKGKPVMSMAPEALMKIQSHAWPGNIRELKNVLQYAVLFSREETIMENLIILDPSAESARQEAGLPAPEPKHEENLYHSLSAYRANEMEGLLKENGGNVHRLARKLAVTPRSLYYYFRRKRIDPKKFRTPSA